MSNILIEKNIRVPMRDFDRNSNTGGVIAGETRDQYQPAINRIFHQATHPSRLILPIIER